MNIEISLVVSSSVLITAVISIVSFAVRLTKMQNSISSNIQSLICINSKIDVLETSDVNNRIALGEIKTELANISEMQVRILDKLEDKK